MNEYTRDGMLLVPYDGLESERSLSWWEKVLYALFGIGCLVGLASVLYVLVCVPLPATTIFTH